jgi:Glycosyltransferase family 92/F5/8 type C domain
MPQYRFSLVACARWEETHIQEWIEYHKSIGFDHVYLYSNDDDPTPLFRAIAPYAYGPDPFVTFRHWPEVGKQAAIYLHFLDTFRHETQWFSFLDIDEFLVFKRLNNVAAFMRDYQNNVDCLYFNWLIHGHSGKVRRDDQSTLMSHLRRARAIDPHTKMICRSAAIDPDLIRQSPGGAFWHFLDNFPLLNLRCHDVLMRSMEGYSAKFPASSEPFMQLPGFHETMIDRAYIAHFQFRSEEDFMRRVRRGGFPNFEHWRGLWESGSYKDMLAVNNAVYDTYLAAYWHRYTASTLRFSVQLPYGSPPFNNVALNKPSFQSSVFEPEGDEPPGSRLAGGANNGLRNGAYGFHTQFEPQPWWLVDLLVPHRINEIHIYNRPGGQDIAVRANALDLLVSSDGDNWTVQLSRTGTDPFGLDGTPLVVHASPALPYRFVLLRLRGDNFLHLEEVEVYGRPV